VETKTKIFGRHDEATIKQIETCVATGGERGVLCADGHKGYAQPIGGVVAYKDKISLSGVAHSVRLFSHTQFGLSFVVLTFDDRVTDYFARQQVIERLQGAA